MNNSVISSKHHYWVMTFETIGKVELVEVLDSFCDKKFQNKIDLDEGKFIYHCQRKIGTLYGVADLLEPNKVGENLYIYDFYIGEIDLEDKRIFFICYPYKSMQKYIEKVILPNVLLNSNFYVPNVDSILTHMKNRKEVDFNSEKITKFNERLAISGLVYKSDIIKYVANISDNEDQSKADKIQLTGQNPLDSKVFATLSDSVLQLGVETSSLKLNCSLFKLNDTSNFLYGDINMIIDFIGNYRFWIPASSEYKPKEKTLIMVEEVLSFFNAVSGLDSKKVLSKFQDIEKKGVDGL